MKGKYSCFPTGNIL